MAVSMSPKQKVYQDVLQEIRKYIDSNDLEPGDKLPSERELADNLQAGRSSVREALRAMELLGLIETRRGEGTYLSTYRPYQTVELLSSFILQENNTKKDLLITKKVMEKEVAKIAYLSINDSDINQLQSITHNSELDPIEKHVAFFNHLFTKADNLLLAKVWQLMDEFSYTITKLSYDKAFYKELIQLYKTKNYEMIEELFDKLAIRK
ncbi:FadR/GntR family transcriptional regulator [Virgibacillus sp. JSM 102003]|uniref:FadR/GntR family transcriptional regulator n=1 Tax=Virgibacillus sp. JSM 102003 TaxID=1562108 RepID=UPI0035BFBAEE